MGDKGAKQQPAAVETAQGLVADLDPLGEVTSRKMFGGVGIFHESVMFALVDAAGTPFLKADDALAAELGAAGAERHGRMPYWQIPPAVREDPDRLLALARRAATAAHSAKK